MPDYRCPTCGTANPDCYITCHHPACPDGRDQRRLDPPEWKHPRPAVEHHHHHNSPWTLIMVAVITALLLTVAFWAAGMIRPARAMDHGFDPNDVTLKWFEKLQRPDQPGSCCGKGDAYPIEDYKPVEDGSGDFTVKISDGSAKLYPDGTTRNPIATGTEIRVSKDIVNKIEDDLDNPTDVSCIFMTVHAGEVGYIYCFIRHPRAG